MLIRPFAVYLGEARVTDGFMDKEINIIGHQMIRLDSVCRHTGGVLIYMKNKVKIINLEKHFRSKNFWFLGLMIIY